MPINNGSLKEDEFTYYMNVSKAKKLNPNLLSMMERLFGIIDLEKKVSCERTFNYIKPDVIIKHRGISKGLSIKGGSSHVVHNEQIKPFILFLRKEGISSRTQQTILLFQYGDGTMDGTGNNRLTGPEVSLKLKDKIAEANEELNSNKEFIKKFIDRVIFDGVDPEAKKADAIYHGNVKYGVIITRKQLYKHIEKKNWKETYSLHVRPLHLVPAARFAGTEIRNEKKRHIIQCCWPRLSDDFDYISNRYTYYESPHLNKKG